MTQEFEISEFKVEKGVDLGFGINDLCFQIATHIN